MSNALRRAARPGVATVAFLAAIILAPTWSRAGAAPGRGADDAATAATAEALITFLSKEEAQRAIVDDSAEPYFDKLLPHEMTAKTAEPITGETLDEQRKECRRRYQAGVLAFSDEERETLSWYVGRLQPLLERRYPVFAEVPWSFLKVSNKIEGGFPHTRGPHIVMSELMLQQLIAVKDQDPESAPSTIGGVLVHEQTHVLQRQRPELFEPLYTEVWGFRHAARVEGSEDLTRHQLVNPDGTDTSWVFPLRDEAGGDKVRWVWPLIIVLDPDVQVMHPFNLQQLLIDVDPVEGEENVFRARVTGDGSASARALHEVEAYTAALGTDQNAYHPNEISAHLFAQIVTTRWAQENGLAPGRDADVPEAKEGKLEAFGDWADKILGVKADEADNTDVKGVGE